MGAPSSGGGGGGNTGPANRYTAPKPKKTKPDRDISLNKTYSSSREIGLMNQYKKPKQRALDTQKMKDDAFRDQGAYNTRRSLDKLPSFLPGAAILKGLSEKFEKNSRNTRDFFTKKVLADPRGKKNFGYTKDEFQKLSMAKQNKIYGNYITTRRDNKTDGFGTVINEGNDRTSDTQNKPDLKVGKFPTGEGKVTQPLEPSNAEAETDKKYDPRKTKKKGRNQNLLTSARGVMKTSPDYSLGKKSLLGQVV